MGVKNVHVKNVCDMSVCEKVCMKNTCIKKLYVTCKHVCIIKLRSWHCASLIVCTTLPRGI